jgi:HEAT repeat protein
VVVTWLLIYAGLANASASDPGRTEPPSAAVERSPKAEDAAATLSRFPAGHVPATEPVLAAIAALGTAGSRDHLALLSSLEQREAPEVQEAAASAIAELNQRTVDTTRRAFSASKIPSDNAVDKWVRAHESQLARPNGSKLGRTESRMVAYAAIVLDGIKTAQVPAADDDQAEALARELDTDAVPALVHHARSAADGGQESLDAIRAFGVDPERLLLGMSASPKSEIVARVEPTAVEVLVRQGSERTIAVLMERATSGDTAEKVVAIDALGRMIQKVDVPSATCHMAVGRLETASRSREDEAVRDTAMTALAETRTVCRK